MTYLQTERLALLMVAHILGGIPMNFDITTWGETVIVRAAGTVVFILAFTIGLLGILFNRYRLYRIAYFGLLTLGLSGIAIGFEDKLVRLEFHRIYNSAAIAFGAVLLNSLSSLKQEAPLLFERFEEECLREGLGGWKEAA